MSRFLKQSTASQTRTIGQFVDDTDFKTPETALTIANTDVRLKKNGADDVAKNSGGATHDVNGYYHLTLDATDTNTVGELHLHVQVAGALGVWAVFWVLEEVVYDALFGAAAAGYGTAQTGDSFARLGAPAGASVSADIAAIEAQTDDIGTPAGASIAADIAAVKSETAAILADTTVIGTPAGASVSADIAAVKTETASIQSDTDNIQTRLPETLIGGRMDSNAQAAATDLITSTVLADSAVDEILDDPVEGAITLRQAIRLILAAVAAKLSGAASTTVTIRDVNDTANRIVATVDADGNRTAVVLTP